MNTIDAMDLINQHLHANELVLAQQKVIAIESTRPGPGNMHPARLPSSVFERVLRAAVRAGELTEDYRTFCERAYGRATFVRLLESIKLEDAPTVRRRNPFRGITC